MRNRRPPRWRCADRPDLKAIRTTAIRSGDHYVINGNKTFISNGLNCDLVVVVAKTDPQAGSRGVSAARPPYVFSSTAFTRRNASIDSASILARSTRESTMAASRFGM